MQTHVVVGSRRLVAGVIASAVAAAMATMPVRAHVRTTAPRTQVIAQLTRIFSSSVRTLRNLGIEGPTPIGKRLGADSGGVWGNPVSHN